MTDSGNYAGRASAIRETAKWIAAVFAAAGAVLFSGLSFTNVTKAASTEDWILPVALAAVPVLAAAVAVWAAAWVILQAPPETSDLLPTLGGGSGTVAPERAKVEELLPATVAVYDNLDGFEARLREARDAVTEAQDDARSDPIPQKRAVASAAITQLDELQAGVRDVVLCADYIRVKERYGRARWVFLLAAVIATVSAAWSGVEAAEAERTKAAGQTSAPPPAAAKFGEPALVRVFLTEAGREAKVPTSCALEGQRAIAIGGDYRRPLLVFHTGVKGCPKPFTWEPGDREVVLVPRMRSG